MISLVGNVKFVCMSICVFASLTHVDGAFAFSHFVEMVDTLHFIRTYAALSLSSFRYDCLNVICNASHIYL